LTLAPLPCTIRSSRLLTGGKVVVEQTDEHVVIRVGKGDRHDLDTIVVLELDQPAVDIDPVKWTSGSLALGKPATASNVYRNMVDRHGPARAVDDDPGTRWATDAGVSDAWLEVDLGEPATIGRATISEEYDRIRAFELQFRDGDAWKTCAHGTGIGSECTLAFDPVTARYFRLNILEATDGPTLWDFQLFPPDK